MRRSRCIAILLGIALHLATAAARAEEPADAARCTTMPASVRMPPALDAAVDRLLERSSTLRRQCAALAAVGLRLQLRVVVARPDLHGWRARASFRRVAPGRLEAQVDVPFTRDFPELIAHELEHVIEQIDGVNLRQLAAQAASGVAEVADGTFETARAQAAGRAVAFEVQEADRRLRPRATPARPAIRRASTRPGR